MGKGMEYVAAAFDVASANYDVLASLPVVFLYGHRGYRTIGYGIYELENDGKLVYKAIIDENIKN